MNTLLKTFICLLVSCCATVVAQNQPAKPVSAPQQTIEDWKNDVEEEKKVEPTNFTTLFTKMLLLLALSIGFLFVVAFISKRFLSNRMQSSNKTNRIKLVEQRVLSQKTTLSIIEIDNQQLAIAESHNGVTILKELSKKIIPEEK